MNICTGAVDCDCPVCEDDNREAARLEAAINEFGDEGSFYSSPAAYDDEDEVEYHDELGHSQGPGVVPAWATQRRAAPVQEAAASLPLRARAPDGPFTTDAETYSNARKYRAQQDRYWQRKP